MDLTYNELLKKYRALNVAGKYITVNVLVFVVLALVSLVTMLFNSKGVINGVLNLLELPADVWALLCKPWTLLSYMFVHLDLFHLLFNMLALYYFANIFLSLFSTRHFVGVYLLGGFVGALFYVAAYNLFPYFAPVVSHAKLIGASASVLAIVAASAVRVPEYRVRLFLFGEVKLKTIALVTVLLSVLMLSGNNAGGNFAHLGGAFAGWLFAYYLSKGVDVTAFINNTIDFFYKLSSGSLLKRKSKRKGTFKTSGSASRSNDYEYNERKKQQTDEIDRILEKIKKGGYSSLSDEEKRRLFEASGKR